MSLRLAFSTFSVKSLIRKTPCCFWIGECFNWNERRGIRVNGDERKWKEMTWHQWKAMEGNERNGHKRKGTERRGNTMKLTSIIGSKKLLKKVGPLNFQPPLPVTSKRKQLTLFTYYWYLFANHYCTLRNPLPALSFLFSLYSCHFGQASSFHVLFWGSLLKLRRTTEN